jgi:hypothetical protein
MRVGRDRLQAVEYVRHHHHVGRNLPADFVTGKPVAHCLRPLVLSGCQSLAIYRPMLQRPLPAGFVVPAQPVEREKPPTGAEWIHEIKHDGYRMLGRKEGENVRLYSRKAIDWSARLPAMSEAVVIGQDGLTDFEALRRRGAREVAVLYAFDLHPYMTLAALTVLCGISPIRAPIRLNGDA